MAAPQNKRKRESQDVAGRAAPGMTQAGNEFEQHYLAEDDGTDNTDGVMDFAAAFAQHGTDPTDAGESHEIDQMQAQNDGGGGGGGGGGGQSASDTAAAAMAQYHTMTVPQSTEQSFMTQNPADGGDRQGSSADQSSGNAVQRTSSFGDFDVTGNQSSPNGDTSPTGGAFSEMRTPKPQVGSDEWHKVRRDNHKEVERRRRETINEGINELAKIVPGCEKNKGSILQRAVAFITQLKDNETQNIEKWTLEKLLTEQAIAELSSSCDKLKAECQRAWAECETWKKAAQKAGASVGGNGKSESATEDGN